jgi:hypothetical protein
MMSNRTAKTIQIFLPDGNPRGIRIAEITSRTVAAIQIPRSKLEDAAKRRELNNVGVYLLFGESESKPSVYIGEAENSLARLRQHNKSKDFWTHALVFISKTRFFTKSHIKYLEWICCETANKANRYLLENGNTPNQPHVSEPVEADLFDNFETMKILASSLGYPVFDQIKKPKNKEIIICKGKDAYADGEYTEEGLVVFSGSKAQLSETKTIAPTTKRVRESLKKREVLVEENGVLQFKIDHVFASPSAAAAVVLARRANGWQEWKYKDGKTLDEVKRQSS